ncbi:MAG: hypothetical protein FD167_6110, partial [bacterium]
MYQINHLENETQAKTKIVLRGTAQLEKFPQAKEAFLKAAARWEVLINNDVTITIDVDFGTTFFGATFGNNTLGATASRRLLYDYDLVRAGLLTTAANEEEANLYNLLPITPVPTDIKDKRRNQIPMIEANTAVLRTLGLFNSSSGLADATIGFNSNFAFDFDPSNGIDVNSIDFDGVAVHEIGHALGFTSRTGFLDFSIAQLPALSTWDLFRFRPDVTLSTFSTASRTLSTGGEQRFFIGGTPLALSTGSTTLGGDGRQTSHWKDDLLEGNLIGVMDPTLSRGQR